MIKILVAEDEEKSRAATVSRLRGIMGDEALIETAADGNDAVQMALKMRPVLIFMDIEMPRKTGLEAAAILHEQLPDTHIVFLTAYDRFDYAVGALRTIAMVMALIATASMFGWLLAYLKIPAMVTTALLGISTNKIVILLLINVMCLILGCIMDMGPLILILTPILLPVATQLGMEPVQFGAMLILNLAIGLCTPPVGAALFAGCSIGRIKIEHATKACLPFYAMMILVLMLVTFVQPISMFVPHLMAAMGN